MITSNQKTGLQITLTDIWNLARYFSRHSRNRRYKNLICSRLIITNCMYRHVELLGSELCVDKCFDMCHSGIVCILSLYAVILRTHQNILSKCILYRNFQCSMISVYSFIYYNKISFTAFSYQLLVLGWRTPAITQVRMQGVWLCVLTLYQDPKWGESSQLTSPHKMAQHRAPVGHHTYRKSVHLDANFMTFDRIIVRFAYFLRSLTWFNSSLKD